MNPDMRRPFAFVVAVLAAAPAVHLSTLAAPARAAAPQHAHAPAATPAARVTPMKSHTGPLPPMPRLSVEPPRPLALIDEVYTFAARHPEVLQYVPCYCGCERDGHTGNHDCFVASRAADGRVVEWNTHGIGCTICIDVARDAMTLHRSGATVPQIRDAIDQKYGTRYPSSTATPHVH